MRLNIGENIREYRKKLGLTQAQLAEHLGVSEQSVSRWELGNTYPDMELLPTLAEQFGITIDELMGMPNQKKEQQALEVFKRLSEVAKEHPLNPTKVNECIRDIRCNYLESEHFWNFTVNVKASAYMYPEVLPEVRFTAEALLNSHAHPFTKNSMVELMAVIEDEEHLEKFLESYAASENITKSELLCRRYIWRKDWEKFETVRQKRLYGSIDNMIGNPSMWHGFGKIVDLDDVISLNELQISLLRDLCRDEDCEKYPVSGGENPDLWVHERLMLGFRKAALEAAKGNGQDAYIILEDAVNLLEQVMKITTPVILSCKSPWLKGYQWSAEESWAARETGVDVSNKERNIWIHDEEGNCYVIWPSCFKEMLVIQEGKEYGEIWKYFDEIRNEERYKQLVGRVDALVQVKTDM